MERRDFLKLGALLPTIPEVAMARVAPEDVLVVSTDIFLSQNERKFIADKLRAVFPHNAGLILDGGLKLEVLRKGAV